MQDLPPITARPLWVFGYGSLMWNPEFPVAERRLARLSGFRRSFCMSSIHHRGTEAEPGLVLALDPAEEGVCDGIAFRVSAGEEAETVAALRERELVSSAYLERQLDITLDGEIVVNALTYVVDTAHVQYCGGLSLEAQAGIIAHAVGGRGPNDEYLVNTASHLAELGIADSDLDWLVARVRHLKAETRA
ncbi:MAG: gamma-glutamylcyclotransferase [Pseudomonadota bacterium]